MDKFIEQQNEEYKSRAIKLNPNDFKIASDYRTKEEEALFKKPKKSRKERLRSKTVKADDILPLQEQETTIEVASRASRAETSSGDTVTENKVSLKDIDFEMKLSRGSDSEDDYVASDDVNNDYLNIKVNDEALDELHETLSKIRKRTIRTNIDEIAQKIIHERDLNEENLNKDQLSLVNRMEIANEPNSAITMDSMSEFVRHLGESTNTTYRMDEARAKMEVSNTIDEKSSSEDEFDTKNIEMDMDEEEQDRVAILDDEPVVDRGLGSALKLAVNKGYLEQEKGKQNARLKGDINVKNYFVEEKNFYDIDDKYSRSKSAPDRYTNGPISEFRDKEGYKPDIKLEYVDEGGRRMNEKEAFRYLSHKFHGKGPGKTKTEKRIKKQKEAELMNEMSSIDTPLNTVALLQEKQKKLQQPFVVLSAPKGGKLDQITLKKP
jgi:U4/U6.U5 tri-snRNP-associated protein 1